jgi:hypothetical protein
LSRVETQDRVNSTVADKHRYLADGYVSEALDVIDQRERADSRITITGIIV